MEPSRSRADGDGGASSSLVLFRRVLSMQWVSVCAHSNGLPLRFPPVPVGSVRDRGRGAGPGVGIAWMIHTSASPSTRGAMIGLDWVGRAIYYVD